MVDSRRRALLGAIALLASGCASNQFVATQKPADGVSLKNAKLQVYSFLDLRDTELGPNLLSEFERQFTEQLARTPVEVRVLRFKNSATGKYFATTAGGMSVPVKDTIDGHANEEREFGASYRLIIFPSRLRLAGAWRFYDIQWELVDATTNRRVWGTTSQGKHMNAWSNDEDPKGRAKTIVDGIVAEMKNSQII